MNELIRGDVSGYRHSHTRGGGRELDCVTNGDDDGPPFRLLHGRGRHARSVTPHAATIRSQTLLDAAAVKIDGVSDQRLAHPLRVARALSCGLLDANFDYSRRQRACTV